MRLLLISNTPFLPATAGNRTRIAGMVEFLASHDVEIGMLMLPAADIVEWDLAEMRQRLAFIEVAEPSRVNSTMDRIRRALRTRAPERAHRREAVAPIGIDDWCPSWFRARAVSVVTRWVPHAILVEYVFLSACIPAIQTATTSAPLALIDTHDIMHQRPAAYAAVGLSPQWFHTTAGEERRGLARADTVLAIQDDDAATLRQLLPERTVLTVPHGHAIQATALSRSRPGQVLFVASRNELNVRGLQWFCTEVWPGIRAKVGDVQLSICGTVAEKVEAVPAGATVHGPLPSLSDEYARARLVINPVHGGTGLKIKVVEALCHGRPVLSTSATLGGIGAAGHGVVVAETSAQFIEAAVAILQSTDLAGRLAEEAARYAARCFSPEAAYGPLLDHIRRSGEHRRHG